MEVIPVCDLGQEPLEDGFAPLEIGKRDPLVGEVRSILFAGPEQTIWSAHTSTHKAEHVRSSGRAAGEAHDI